MLPPDPVKLAARDGDDDGEFGHREMIMNPILAARLSQRNMEVPRPPEGWNDDDDDDD